MIYPLLVDVEITTDYNLDIDMSIDHQLDVEVSTSGSLLPVYDGDHIVEPRKIEQTLLTQNKSLINNITVNPIHYTETSNDSGGTTVIIGYE